MNTPATLTRDGIAALIPHSGNMCLLDRLTEWSAQRIVCKATNHRDINHPLRTRTGLLSSCAIEYAAQAMALHGALLGQQAGAPAMPGYLASARSVQLHVLRLDNLPIPTERLSAKPLSGEPLAADELHIEAIRQAGDAQQILYSFTVSHAGQPIAQGRAAVVLNTALAT
jgi:predicted hotdog family 3-hydroxylacyl-ACP dehydratase